MILRIFDLAFIQISINFTQIKNLIPTTMKKLIVLLLGISLLGLVFSPAVSAQEQEKDFRFTIKTNPLAAAAGPLWVVVIPITGEYRLLFESRTLQKQSVQIGASYLGAPLIINPDTWTKGDTGLNFGGYRVQFMYKFFITGEKAPEGFYIAPHISWATAKIKSTINENDYLQASKLNLNAVLGYQIISKGGFALDIFTGLGLKNRDYKLSENGNFLNIDNLNDVLGKKYKPSLAFGLNFGYAF